VVFCFRSSDYNFVQISHFHLRAIYPALLILLNLITWSYFMKCTIIELLVIHHISNITVPEPEPRTLRLKTSAYRPELWQGLIYTHSSSLDRGEWIASHPGRFTPRERTPGTHWIGGLRARGAVWTWWRGKENPSPCRKSHPCRPTRSLVAVLTGLPRLKLFYQTWRGVLLCFVEISHCPARISPTALQQWLGYVLKGKEFIAL
jgi:hypothetical protein